MQYEPPYMDITENDAKSDFLFPNTPTPTPNTQTPTDFTYKNLNIQK